MTKLNIRFMKKSIKIFISLLGLSSLYTSCQYKEIANAQYPDQVIYMPASVNGIYKIVDSPDTYTVPTPGVPVSYLINNDEVLIPLGIYRAGKTSKGSFSVKVSANNDSVNHLINEGPLKDVARLLPAKYYSLPEMINVDNGMDHATFNLSVDLKFLEQNEDEQFAIGVKISSNERKVNPDFSTTIVLIDPKVIH